LSTCPLFRNCDGRRRSGTLAPARTPATPRERGGS
jgi:hypothetical protein